MDKRQPADTVPARSADPKRPAADEKRSIIDAIRQINHGVSLSFLSRFDAEALGEYLEQLQRAGAHEPRIARRIQPMRMAS